MTDYDWVSFKRRNLDGVSFEGLSFEGSTFSYALLKKSNFRNTHHKGTNFTGANLEEADFTGATLIKADFTGANLHGTIFTDVTLEDCVGLPGEKLNRWIPALKEGTNVATVTTSVYCFLNWVVSLIFPKLANPDPDTLLCFIVVMTCVFVAESSKKITD